MTCGAGVLTVWRASEPPFATAGHRIGDASAQRSRVARSAISSRTWPWQSLPPRPLPSPGRRLRSAGEGECSRGWRRVPFPLPPVGPTEGAVQRSPAVFPLALILGGPVDPRLDRVQQPR